MSSVVAWSTLSKRAILSGQGPGALGRYVQLIRHLGGPGTSLGIGLEQILVALSRVEPLRRARVEVERLCLSQLRAEPAFAHDHQEP